jgi:peptidoglycan hydrolase-like protein with peptidoglycan-binding domain
VAVDLCLYTADGSDVIWEVNAEFKKVIAAMKAKGFEWGGDWKSFKDYPHFELYNVVDGEKIKPYTSAASAPASNKGYLEKSDSGDAVKELQTLLNKAGYDVGEVDGEFGAKTDAQVRKFQSEHGLDVDGVVGEKTISALKSAVSDKTPYRVVIPNTAFWQAKALVQEFEGRDFKCEGVALKTYGPNEKPEEGDPYQFVIYTDQANASQLVSELKDRGYGLTYSEAK